MINFQSNLNFQFSKSFKFLVARQQRLACKAGAVILTFSFLVFSFSPVFAGDLIPCKDDCTLIDLFQLIKNVMGWMLLYGGIFATLFIAGGGIMMLISRGNPGQITKARMWITYAVIGLLLIFCAWLIINTIFIVLNYALPGKWETIGDEIIK